MMKLKTTIFLLCMHALSYAQPMQWDARGMGGGGAVYSPSINPHNSNEVYLSCDMGLMSKSNDFCDTWRTIHFDTLIGHRHSKVNFTNHPDTMYVETLDKYTSRNFPAISVDGGNNWSVIGQGGKSFWGAFGSFRLFANPNNSRQIVASKYDSVCFSNNWGASFVSIHSAAAQGSSFIHLAGALFTNDTIFISTDRGLLISPDNGNTWLPFINYNTMGITTGAGNSAVVSFGGAVKNNVTRFFATTIYTDSLTVKTQPVDIKYFLNLYRMNWNVAQIWNNITSNLTGTNPHNKVYQVVMNNNNPDTVYFTGQMRVPPIYNIKLGTVFKSVDGGNTITNIFLQNPNSFNTAMSTGWVGGTNFPNWEHAWSSLNTTEGLCIDPNNINRLVRSDFSIACTTIDGGATWQQKYVSYGQHNAGIQISKNDLYSTNGLQTTVCHWMKWLSPARVLAAYSDLLMNESNDSGHTWGFLYDSLWAPKVNDIAMFESTPGGRLFAPEGETLGNNGDWSDYRLSITTGGKIMYSDNALNWHLLKDFGKPASWASLNPNDTTTLFVSVLSELNGPGGIYKYTGLPNSPVWTLLSAPPRTEKRPTQIFALTNGDLLAVYGARDNTTTPTPLFNFTASSGIYLSTNGGISWIDLCVAYPGMQKDVRYLTIDPNDPLQNTWLVGVGSSGAGSVPGLYRTTNRGASFQNVWPGKVVSTCTMHPYNPAEMYVCTAQDGLYYATAANTNNPVFSKVTTYPFRAPERVFYNPYNINEVWVTSWGNGLRVGTNFITGNALPIELISFTGFHNNERNFLNWVTASEVYNKKFEIERSYDMHNFITIGEVAGKAQTGVFNKYNFVDFNPPLGINSYRLKQIDFTGDFKYSNTIVIANPNDGFAISVFPIPFKESFYLNVFSKLNISATAIIYNSEGEKMQEYVIAENENEIRTDKLAKGVYTLKVFNAHEVKFSKLIKY